MPSLQYSKPLAALTLGAALTLQGTPASAADITIDAGEARQEIYGFGACIIGWGQAPFPRMYNEAPFLDAAINQLGMSVFRMPIWPDVSTTPVENWEDISYEDFDWANSRARVYVQFAKTIKAMNPEIRIIGTSWSPPGWMKENGKITGTRSGFLLNTNRGYDDDNRLKDDHLQHFAKYIVEYQKYLIKEGIPMEAIGVQNEPMFTQDFESAFMTGEEYANAVKAVAEMFIAEGMERPLFFGPEDMTMASYNPGGGNMDQTRHNAYVENLMRPDVAPYFDVWATHGYTDGVQGGGAQDPGAYWESVKQFNRPYWITEGGTGGHDWPVPILTGIGAHLHYALVDGNASAFVPWQISDSVANQHGVMVRDKLTKKSYAAMHYWHHIRPGAVRISAEPSDDGVRVSAFRNPDSQTMVIVAINPTTDPLPLNLAIQGVPVDRLDRFRTTETLDFADMGALDVVDGVAVDEVPALSITTYVGLEGWTEDEMLGWVYQLDGGWLWHGAGLGYVYNDFAPWVYTFERGWEYLQSGNFQTGLFLFNADLGWLYTDSIYHPWFYSYDSSEWLNLGAQ